MSAASTKFLKDYIPKDALRRNEFLEKYPNFDGRGILIAVLDCGIDVSLDGLKQTSDEKPKIIDCFDFTEAGHVDTSTMKVADSDNCLIGLSGRKLKIPTKWSNSSDKWHLGIKSLHEYFPSAVLRDFAKKQKTVLSTQNQLLKEKIEGKVSNKAAMDEYLKSTEEHLSKASMVADCIVWFDGLKWQACVDTSFKGELKDAKVLTNFRDGHGYDTFAGNFAYCVTVRNEGNLLEIITTSSDHGSYIAQIAAAYFPGEPERDGLAPGAQIVSMCVMDTRKDHCLDEKALIQALNKCIEMKVDIINYSVNGFTAKTQKIVKEMVEKHGIIVIKSSGNAGPVYFSTNSYDTPIFDYIFLIGSIITHDMRKNIYNIEEEDENNNESVTKVYGYSSRGPNLNGSHTVDFVAPGSAVTPVSKFNNVERDHCIGTSFAAPNAVGAITCLLTALKENSIQYSPAMIKLILSKTAYLPENENKLEFGDGIIQIDAAFDYFRKMSNKLSTFNTATTSIKLYKTEAEDTYIYALRANCFLLKATKNAMLDLLLWYYCIAEMCFSRKLFIKFLNVHYIEMKGVIFKKVGEKNEIKKYRITVADNANGSNFQLSCDSAPFIEHSQIKNSVFTFKIDPTSLQPGSFNHAEIQASDSTSLTPIFSLPITVILPLNATEIDNYCIQKELLFESSVPQRFFIQAPANAYYCCIKLTALDPTIPETEILIYYAIEKCDIEISKYRSRYLKFNSSAPKIKCYSTTIYPNYMYEFCLVQDEAIKRPSKFKVEIDFLGLYLTKKNAQNLTLTNYLKDFTGCVSLKLYKISYIIFATSFKFERIKIAGVSKLYMKLIYNFKISKPTKCSFYVHRNFRVFKAQVFTASHKFIHQFFYTDYMRLVELPTGSYYVALYFEKNLTTTTLPFLGLSPGVTVMMHFENAVTANLYSSAEKNEETKILKDKPFSIIKNGKYLIHYDYELPTDLATPLSSRTTVYGTLFFSYGETEGENSEFNIGLSCSHSFKPKIKYSKKIKNKLTDILRSFLPYSSEMKNLLNSIVLPNMAIKYEKQISKLYFTNNHKKLLENINLCLTDAIQHTSFLQNCDLVKTTVYKHEKEIIERQKNAIIDILFIKADAMLDECLKDCSSVPAIFKERFGYGCVKEKFCLKKSWGQILGEKILYFFKIFSQIFITSKKEKIQNGSAIANKADPYDFDIEIGEIAIEKNLEPNKTENNIPEEFDLENNHYCNNAYDTVAASKSYESSECNIPSIKSALNIVGADIQLPEINLLQTPAHLTEHQREIEKVVLEFLDHSDEDDIRKNLIQAKKALVFGEVETAVFYLNKISIKCHTIPEFKFIDVAIIKLLKQLGWNHLTEAHHNALLDRHRDY